MTQLIPPKVTVLMPVYNGEAFIKEAIESILNQTFTDFEFLIINDGSTDRSMEIINSFKDTRIRLVHNEKNLGLIDTLNKGIDISQGQYIARMDCDDVSLPTRLSMQVSFMESHPDVGVCGAWMETIGRKKNVILRYATDDNGIKSRLIFESVIAHPTVMMRKKLFKKNVLRYDSLYLHAEDYALWVQASGHCSFANIDKVLVYYRMHQNQIGKSYLHKQIQSADSIRCELIKFLGIMPTPEDILLHSKVGTYRFHSSRALIEQINIWLMKLGAANDKSLVYDKRAFAEALSERWLLVCHEATDLGLWIWKTFWRSSLSKTVKASPHQKIKFLVKCILKHTPDYHIAP